MILPALLNHTNFHDAEMISLLETDRIILLSVDSLFLVNSKYEKSFNFELSSASLLMTRAITCLIIIISAR